MVFIEDMKNRRQFVGGIGVVGVTALAGCTGILGGGTTVEVTENEYEGTIEVDDHEIDERSAPGGTEAVLTGTVTNTGDEEVAVGRVAGDFYDDDVLLGESFWRGDTIEPGDSHQYDIAVFDADSDDVDRVELRIVE